MKLDSRVQTSTLCLVTIGLFDLVTTIILLGQGFAEGNRLFAWLLQFGPWVFVFGKVVFLAGPILILEYARTKKPKVAEVGTWIAVVAYLAMYVPHLWQLRAMFLA